MLARHPQYYCYGYSSFFISIPIHRICSSSTSVSLYPITDPSPAYRHPGITNHQSSSLFLPFLSTAVPTFHAFFCQRDSANFIPCRSKMTSTYEGSLIRLFRRLEELLRQMAQAAKVMGNEDLTKKFDDSLQKIRRDIVATQSLYL